MQCTLIGTVSTPFTDTADAPSQGFHDDARGVVTLSDEYVDGLAGFDADSVVIVWWADHADRSVLKLDRDGRGVFTTRSPARPNPVCLTECAVRDVDTASGRLVVEGVDMADGSPVVDLKSSLRERRE